MNESECLARMKAPINPRPGIWRNGVLQIHITRACDLACYHCTQGSNFGGKPVMITPEQFEEACISLRGYWGVVGVFGGNPCVHPQFEELCRIMRKHIPFDQRGLWSNNLRGNGAACRATFNPVFSNLNVHLDSDAADEMRRDWPEAARFVKGDDNDSRHGPPFVAMSDVEPRESIRWEMISRCDVNQFWSAMICVVRGQLRAFFCELAGAQAMLHQDNPNWNGTGQPMPDTGMAVSPGWWESPMSAYVDQVRVHCHACGIPLKGYGQLAVGGDREQISETHRFFAKPKQAARSVELVQLRSQLGEKSLPRATDYIQNSALQ